MTSVALGPLLAVASGMALVQAGVEVPAALGWGIGPLWAVALAAWCVGPRASHVTYAAILGCIGLGGAVLTSRAESAALRPTLRSVLNAHTAGFLIDDPWAAPQPDPIHARVVLDADAAPRQDAVSLRGHVTAVRVSGAWIQVEGGVALSVGGAVPSRVLDLWHEGVEVEAPVAFRRPARFFNEGVPNGERMRALSGTALGGSVKSALVVVITGPGSWVDRVAASTRVLTRRAVSRALGDGRPTSSAIVRAVLIGDDDALPADVRERWQAAGTYHVLAISGGNIVVVVMIALTCGRLAGRSPRAGALAALGVVATFALVVVSGPSVRRAAWMAGLHLMARVLDHRAGPWQVFGAVATGLLIVDPLGLRDPGVLLTCGATAALIACRRQITRSGRNGLRGWVLAPVVASLAVEAVVLPIGLAFFNRVSLAGLALNVVALPVMTIVQVVGLVIVVMDAVGLDATALGWLAHVLITGLDWAFSMTSAMTWSSWWAPAPETWTVMVYYAAILVRQVTSFPGVRLMFALVAAVAAAMMTCPTVGPDRAEATALRVSMLDVGQAEAILVEADGHRVLVDAGGRPFGDSTDVGHRVVVPSLWARAVAALDGMLITHGDPDHIGGSLAVFDALRVGTVWHGVPVHGHEPMRTLRTRAAAVGSRVEELRAGDAWSWGQARVRVLHPPEPDWERRRVRNDDSVVLEIGYGDVTVLLAGDISADVERAIVPRLTPSRVRVLKVAHHGSRTSTSATLVEAWRPQVALVSCGRGNTFGHPTRVVLDRLLSAGATVFRTDRDGQLTVRSNGRDTWVETYRGHALWLR